MFLVDFFFSDTHMFEFEVVLKRAKPNS